MHKHFTRDDRVALAALLRVGYSQASAALELKFDPSAVSRELNRNPRDDGSYHATHADVLALKRRQRSKINSRKIENDRELSKTIESFLSPLYSPEVIAHELGIVHQTIYAWIDRSRPDLKEKLPYHGRKRRRYGTKRQQKQGWTRHVRSIDERPKAADRRKRVGDWEGDTVNGINGALLTHVDRRSRFTFADLVADKGADTAHEKICERFDDVPAQTITYDRGSEFALWKMIEEDIDAEVYFANAHHPWERGTNENTNGRLRRIFPKGFDFSTILQRDVEVVTDYMNHTPRKILDWRTPCEVFGQCCVSD